MDTATSNEKTIVHQGIIASSPSPQIISRPNEHLQTVVVLPYRSDGSIKKGVLAFTATKPVGGVERQLKDIWPVILINKFKLDPQDVNQFLKAWTSDAEIMKQQPGFISTQMHRGIAESCAYINYAIWESTSQFKQALSNPQFQTKMSDFPASVIASPHLFKKIAVPGICVE